MAIGRRIATLKYRELVVLFKIFLKHPLYLLPTYKATNKTIAVCNRLYKELHHEDNRANAFRHAFWNYMICKYCLPVTGIPEKAIDWSKEITDLHERLSPNEGLAKKMDLHNNRIGRELFRNSFGKEEEEAMSILQQMSQKAIQVKTVAEIEAEKNNLVFIENL